MAEQSSSAVASPGLKDNIFSRNPGSDICIFHVCQFQIPCIQGLIEGLIDPSECVILCLEETIHLGTKT